MTGAELRQLFDKEKAREQVEIEAEAKEQDEWAPHNEATANALFNYWRDRPHWTVEEAVALRFGKEPTKVNSASLQRHANKYKSPFVLAYENFRRDIELAIASGDLQQPIKPLQFVSWLQEQGIHFPEVGFPSSAAKQINDETSELETLRAENHELKSRIAEFEGQNKVFTSRERNNILAILIIIAEEKYRLNPFMKKSELGPKLSTLMVQKVTNPLTGDVINAKLREAAKFLIPELSNKLRDAAKGR